MNWGAFDLNLLIVFDAVMQERSVTRAGGKIGLSQPAVSHALSRLRHMLKDELFIRTPDGMVPTPRAEQLAVPLRRALNDLHLALEPETFVPQEASRRFVLALNNYAAVVLASSIVTAVTLAAPGIRLDLRPSGTRDLPALLDRGELDLAIGSFEDVGDRFARVPRIQQHDLHVAAKFPEDLTARPARRRQHIGISRNCDPAEFTRAFRDRLENRHAFGAKGETIGRVFDVAARVDAAGGVLQRGANAEIRKRRVRMFTRGERGVRKGVVHGSLECTLWRTLLSAQAVHAVVRDLAMRAVRDSSRHSEKIEH